MPSICFPLAALCTAHFVRLLVASCRLDVTPPPPPLFCFPVWQQPLSCWPVYLMSCLFRYLSPTFLRAMLRGWVHQTRATGCIYIYIFFFYTAVLDLTTTRKNNQKKKKIFKEAAGEDNSYNSVARCLRCRGDSPRGFRVVPFGRQLIESAFSCQTSLWWHLPRVCPFSLSRRFYRSGTIPDGHMSESSEEASEGTFVSANKPTIITQQRTNAIGS